VDYEIHEVRAGSWARNIGGRPLPVPRDGWIVTERRTCPLLPKQIIPRIFSTYPEAQWGAIDRAMEGTC